MDYGVRRRSTATPGKPQKRGEALPEEEKFLKGVSIYLKKRLFSNSVTRDLWEGIQEASGEYIAIKFCG